MSYLDEAQVGIVTVDYFRELGYEHIHGPVIVPDGEALERSDFAEIAPSAPTLDAFMINVTPLHEWITLNVSQTRRLAGLRDTLLPKRLNGEIELPAALSACDAQAGEAVAKEVS